jgi:Family of unknown function (DUF6763)
LHKNIYLLYLPISRSTIGSMDRKPEPIVGNWYRYLDKGQMFRVIAVDENDGFIELQHFDGDIEELDAADWNSLELEVAEPPEDWTGPIDDIERDDLGYSETAMSGGDWREPLQEISRERAESGEPAGSEDDAADFDDASSIEESWEPEKIDSIDAGTDERPNEP